MCLQPGSAGNAHPEAGDAGGRVAMEIQPMSHLQRVANGSCVMAHFPEEAGKTEN